MGFLDQLGDRASRAGRRIVLAEGHDERVQEAARRIRQSGHLDLTLLIHEWGNAPQDAGDVRCPEDDPELARYLDSYGELLASEASEPEAARQLLCDPLYFAGMMVRAGDADGAVAGAVNSTGSVIRAALRCIGTAAGSRLVSGAFYMVVPPFRGTPEPEVLTFADAGAVPYVRAIADNSGRLMVLMTHNTDIQDSWEREGDDASYFYAFSPRGYAFGINAFLYALTH